MSDIVDRGNEAADLFLDVALRNRQRDVKTPTAIGLCLNCGESTEGERRWCDAECRDEWERDKKY